MSVRITVHAEEFIAFMKSEPERAKAVLRDWQQQGSRETEQQMSLFAPIRTGTYRESIGSRFTPKGFVTYPNVDYADIVEEGTGPHIIRPRNAKALRWFNEAGAQFFAKKVEHPGTAPQHVVKRTAEQMRGVLGYLYRRIWETHH